MLASVCERATCVHNTAEAPDMRTCPSPALRFRFCTLVHTILTCGLSLPSTAWYVEADTLLLLVPSVSQDMPNTFLAQAYDLDDEWLSFAPQGPCYEFGFNQTSPHHQCCGKGKNLTLCTSDWQQKCQPACAALYVGCGTCSREVISKPYTRIMRNTEPLHTMKMTSRTCTWQCATYVIVRECLGRTLVAV